VELEAMALKLSPYFVVLSLGYMAPWTVIGEPHPSILEV
jgi:hypothetical protein